MASELLELVNIISNSVVTIDSRCKLMSKDFPRLDEPFDPTSEQIRLDAEVTRASDCILAAAAQLIASVRRPTTALLDCAAGFLLSAALATVSSGAVAEILTEAGPQGCHVNEIAEKNNMDASKLGRLLRPLATHHIFREVSPDVFSHNSVSSLLDTGKPIAAVVGNPVEKHKDATGFSCVVECHTDEVFKAAAYMKETLMGPTTSHSGEPTECALNLAFNTNDSIFAWYERPDNLFRLRRFTMAMDGNRRASPPEAVLQGFDWSLVPSGRHVIDVGGGVGSISLAIAKVHPSLTIVVQDRPGVLGLAKEHWTTNLPAAITNERVIFQAHDFFTPQPPENQGNAVFLLRFILHDWSDTYALKILKHLRAAAAPDSKLVIIDYIVPYACKPDKSSAEYKIPGAENLALIKDSGPLLPNLGIANARAYLADLQLMVVLNGQERTLGQFSKLFATAGWKIEQVYRLPNAHQQQIVAVPN